MSTVLCGETGGRRKCAEVGAALRGSVVALSRLMRTKLLVAVVLCACGPVDEREASVEPTAEVHQALSTVHLPVTNLGTAAGRCFSEAIPPYGTVAAAAWDTGIDCATPRTWDATPYTGLLAVPASDSLRSRATSMSHAMQIKGTGVGLVLDTATASTMPATRTRRCCGSRRRPRRG